MIYRAISTKADASQVKTTPKEDTVLAALYNNEMYGLQIPKAIEESSDGTRSISQGALYPILAKLEKKNLVSSRWGDDQPAERGGARRRYYRLTPHGRAKVDQTKRFFDNLLGWQPGSAT